MFCPPKNKDRNSVIFTIFADIFQIEEVKGVRQILDEEEEISLQEFAKFEEKLKQQKRVVEDAAY